METRSLIKIIVLVLLCLVVHAITSGAQTLYTKNSQITVATNTAITVRGSVENAGTILNNGHLKVSGPWINSGVYVPGEGMVTFNSTSATVPQIIHHNGQSFNRVTLSGATKKIILSDLTIAREIHFQNGVVEAAGDAKA